MRFGKRAMVALAIGIVSLLLAPVLTTGDLQTHLLVVAMFAAVPVSLILGIIGIVVDRPRMLAIVVTVIAGGLIALAIVAVAGLLSMGIPP